jgi:hypothetical protein
MTPPARTGLADQEPPIVQVVGRIAGAPVEDSGSIGNKYLVHVGWSKKTYQVSQRGLRLIRNLDIQVLDDPTEYTI